jgi:hypothetical protein
MSSPNRRLTASLLLAALLVGSMLACADASSSTSGTAPPAAATHSAAPQTVFYVTGTTNTQTQAIALQDGDKATWSEQPNADGQQYGGFVSITGQSDGGMPDLVAQPQVGKTPQHGSFVFHTAGKEYFTINVENASYTLTITRG